jgi:hypothetical protein
MVAQKSAPVPRKLFWRYKANARLADYLVPVNAGIGELDVIFVAEED